MRNSIIILAVASLMMVSCLGVEKVTLGDGNTVVRLKKGKPALTYKKGNVLNELDWQASEGITLEQNENGFTASTNGLKQGEIGAATINYDYRGGLAIRIKARAEGDSPTLRLQLKDALGAVANGKTLDEKIVVENESRYYYFDLDGAFIQSYPEMKEVNAAYINSFKFLINPTGGTFNGKLYIEEVKVILSSEVIRKKKLIPSGVPGGMISDFSEGIADWKAQGAYTLTHVNGAMKVASENVGPKYQAIRRDIPTVNFKEHTKLKAWIKVEGTQDVAVRFDLEDYFGNVTNSRPVYVRLYPSDEYQVVIFDFKNRFQQSYPKKIEVDPTRIVKIKMMLNPGLMPYTGSVVVDKIEVVE